MLTSDPWFGTSGPRDAKIVLVGEAFGREEELANAPFVGQAGQELTRMLSEAGVKRDECFFTNIVPRRPGPDNDFLRFIEPGEATVALLRPGQEVRAGLENLFLQLDAIAPKVIVACGNWPLWALTNYASKGPKIKRQDGALVHSASGISSMRGSQLFRVQHRLHDARETSVPVLPIMHPAAILRQWSERPFAVHDLKTRIPLALRSKWLPDPPYAHVHRPTFEQVVGQLSRWIFNKTEFSLACDIETRASSIITCIGFADSERVGFCIPFAAPDGEHFRSYWSAREEQTILKLLRRLFSAPHIRFVGQNFLYDIQFLSAFFGVTPRLSFDTLIAQNLLFPGTQKDLGFLSSLYCSHHRYWKDDSRDWSTTGTFEQLLRYNCEDAARTLEIANRQKELLTQQNLDKLLPFELEKFDLALEMMQRGVRVDLAERQRVAFKLIESQQQLADRLLRIVPQALVDTSGKSVWFKSALQRKWVLGELLGLKVPKSRKTGNDTTGKEAIADLSLRYPRLRRLFEMIADVGSLGVYFSTFIQAKLELNGRYAPSFNPAGTKTFRFSSSKNAFDRGGNMQNIPAGSDEA